VINPVVSKAAASSEIIDVHAGRLLEIDGFRAIAAWMVMLHHSIYAFPNPPSSIEPLTKPVLAVLSRGWLGVDLFFVLSGFLITGILLDTRSKPHYFRNFYVRRVLRIMPLYYVTLFVIWIFWRHPTGYFLLSVVFLSNFEWLFGTGYAEPAGVYWSLAVEEHFYLVWPLLVRRLNRRHLTIVLLAIVAGSPVLRGVCAHLGMNPDRAIYQYTWFRLDGLALGALLAIWFRSSYQTRRRSLRLGGGLLLVAIVVTLAGAPFGLLQTKSVASLALRYTQVQQGFAAAVVTSLALQGSRWTALLRSKFALFSSDISYCTYLVHLSVGQAYLWLLRTAGVDPAAHLGGFGALLLRMLAIVGGTVTIGVLSKRFLEDPFLRMKRRFA
jgi:peptidoglycan/LPS O-acetylase OafA/YrhL